MYVSGQEYKRIYEILTRDKKKPKKKTEQQLFISKKSKIKKKK